MKVVIAGGGTAGHVYPGLALAEALSKRRIDIEISWFGTPQGIEAKLIKEAGYDFIPIDAKGMQNRFSLRSIKPIINLIRIYRESKKILKKLDPDLVIGMGGYVSLPVMLAASGRFKTFIFEQNSIPGLSNRLLSSRVDEVILSFDESRSYFKRARAMYTSGNPIRKEIGCVSRIEAANHLGLDEDRFTVLVFGGSGGARTINNSVIETYDRFRKFESLRIIHIVGNMDYESVSKTLEDVKKKSDNVSYFLYRYMQDIWRAYALSDLVICRAGATTIAEITAAGLPSILIPYPYATKDHQTKNAQIIERAGAAKILRNDALNSDVLFDEISWFMEHRDELENMSKKSLKISRPDAAKDAIDHIISSKNK